MVKASLSRLPLVPASGRKARPILMSAPMVRACLDGSKTQTRRIVKGVDPSVAAFNLFEIVDERGVLVKRQFEGLKHHEGDEPWTFYDKVADYNCTYGWPGDLLWVREAWAKHNCAEDRVYPKGDGHPWGSPIYRATHGGMEPQCEGFSKWKPSIHMPRLFSRLTLEITEVRVERLQDISEADAIAEGIEPYSGIDPECHGYRNYLDLDHKFWIDPIASYRSLWEHINGVESWSKDPWVWVVSFQAHQKNVDDLLKERAA